MAEDFTRRVARVVAAQLAELTGFDSTQESAIDILAELLIRYITEVCSVAHSYAEVSHRTDFNVFDLLAALEDMGTSPTDLQKYLDAWLTDQGPGTHDQGFVHPLPSEYPVKGGSKAIPSFEEKLEEPPPHVPQWLPAFPDRQTYVRTPAYPGHQENPVKQHEVLQQSRKQAERTALAFRQQLLAVPPHPAGPHANSNPFLQPPAVEAVAAERTDAGAGAAAAFGKDVMQPASTAFEPLVGPAAGGGEGGGPGGGDARRDVDDKPIMWQRAQQQAGPGPMSLPASTSQDFATAVQRQGISFTIRRPMEDAFAARQTDDSANRMAGRKRSSRYDTDERRRVEAILAQSGADQREDDN